MTSTRVWTAIALLGLFLAALFYLPPLYWGLLLLGVTVAGAWEWTRIARLTSAQSAAYLVITFLSGAGLLFLLGQAIGGDSYAKDILWIYAASLLFWSSVVPAILALRAVVHGAMLRMLVGWMVLLPTCLALYQLRAISPRLLLGFLGVIWLADTAAYFVGRRYGRHKLAPGISPGKTWEGVAGALLTALVYGLLWAWAAQDYYHSAPAYFRPGFIMLPLLLTAYGIVGDLFESHMKRQAGLKDSGSILPGHGGILDRIDALTSSLPAAILTVLIFKP